MRFGVCTSIDNASVLAAIGFDYVEVHAGNLASLDELEFAAFLEANAAAPIHAEAANCLFPGEIHLTGPDVDWAAVEAHLNKVFSRLQQAGISNIAFGSGGSRTCPEGFPREDAWRQLVHAGRLLALTGSKYGVTVALEPLRPAESNTINTMAEGARLVREVDHPNFRLLCDLYHVAQGGGVPEDAAACGDLICHVHIAKPDDRRSMHPGDGCDYIRCFRALKSAGYDGRISFEGSCSDYAGELPGVLAVMKQSMEVGT